MGIKLTIRSSRETDTSHDFVFAQGEVLVGRAPSCHLHLPFSFVSGQQFTIVAEGTTYLVADAGSTNGTVLNGTRLAPFAYSPLESGDAISVGELEIEVTLTDASVQPLSLAESSEEVRRMVWETLQTRDAGEGACLEVVAGPDLGARLAIPEELSRLVIGTSHPCDLSLTDPECHEEHLEIVRAGYGFEVRALNEQLTHVDGASVTSPLPLSQESRLVLGQTTIVFCDPLLLYMDELAKLPEERPALHDDDVLSTQQINVVSYDDIGEPQPEFGPPDRPPVPARPRMVESKDDVVAEDVEEAGWGAFEYLMVGVIAIVVLGGLLAILVVLNVIEV